MITELMIIMMMMIGDQSFLEPTVTKVVLCSNLHSLEIRSTPEGKCRDFLNPVSLKSPFQLDDH